MIVVENGQSISDLLSSLDLSVGAVKVDSKGLEYLKIGHDDLFLVESNILKNANDEIVAKLATCFAIIACGIEGKELASKFPNLVAVIDLNDNKQLIKNKIEFMSQVIVDLDVMKSQLMTINNELTEVMSDLDGQLSKIKSVYEKKLPKKLPNLKGMDIFSKYCAGENSGGEFFDFYQNEHLLFIMMSSTNSYLASSTILNIFNELKFSKTISKEVEEHFITNIFREVEIINEHKTKPISINLFTAIIDTKTLEIQGHVVGNYQIHTNGNQFNKGLQMYDKNFALSQYEFLNKLNREDKILIVSPGLLKNLKELKHNIDIDALINNKSIETIDNLDEIFFQIKKDMSSDFLEYDASAILLEVAKNVMHKI